MCLDVLLRDFLLTFEASFGGPLLAVRRLLIELVLDALLLAVLWLVLEVVWAGLWHMLPVGKGGVVGRLLLAVCVVFCLCQSVLWLRQVPVLFQRLLASLL